VLTEKKLNPSFNAYLNYEALEDRMILEDENRAEQDDVGLFVRHCGSTFRTRQGRMCPALKLISEYLGLQGVNIIAPHRLALY
jgi:hypothetical protein